VESDAVADDLQSLLVEVIDLSLTSEQAHWSPGRPLFEPLCPELDDLAADAWGWGWVLVSRESGDSSPLDVVAPSEHVKSRVDPESHSAAWRHGGTLGGR